MKSTWIALFSITFAGSALGQPAPPADEAAPLPAPPPEQQEPAPPPPDAAPPPVTAAAPAPAAAPASAAAPAPAPEPKPALAVSPYGLLVLSFFYNTAPLANADVPTAALPGDDDALGATARQSRFGLKIDAPGTAEALAVTAVTGQFEIDFFGGYYANENNTYPMAHPRLRLFFVRMELGELAIVAGQDWAILAPHNPLSLTHVAIPGFHSSGNLWARLPQVRAEAKLGGLELAGGVLAPTGSGAVEGGSGLTMSRGQASPDKSLMPSLQARVGYGQRQDKELLGAGISGHLGAEELTLTNAAGESATEDLISYAGALDLSIPIGGSISLKGEAYYGQNIDGFFSAANATLTSSAPPTLQPRKAFGGWGQLLVKPDPLTLGAGAGYESVTDEGPRNFAVYLTAIYELAPKLLVGVEWDHLRTTPAGGQVLVGSQLSTSLHFGF
jgi:hypothetical protein